MGITIRSYSHEFLEEHVRLGQELTSNWEFFGQTPLQVMRKQYDREDFDPDTRLYAFTDDGKLVGFQTAKIIEPTFARVEFPIVHPDYPEVLDMLFKHQVDVLRSKGVTTIETRVSSYWGDTFDLAQQYDFEFDRDLYFVTKSEPVDLLIDIPSITHLTLDEYNAIKHAEPVRDILMDCFDTSETLADAYLQSYQETQTELHLNHIMLEDDTILCRITFSTYRSGDSNMAVATIYTHPNHPELLPELLAYLDRALLDYSYSSLQLYFAGLRADQMASVIDTSTIDPVISFYTKDI